MAAVIFFFAIFLQSPAHTVARVVLERTGVRIVYNNGTEAKPAAEKDQVAVSDAAIADDKQTVGWLVQYENCCTSYPIPLKLVLYRSGKVIQRLGNGMAISHWYFWAGGKQVVFHTDTVHGNFAPHCELHDVSTGRLVDQRDGNPDETFPAWARRTGR